MGERPLITFALFAYNQEQFIEDAVKGALSQTYSPLEIILSDDCSSDRTYEIMDRMVNEYKGSHTIFLNRNDQNLGVCAHLNKVFGMSNGEIVVVAAGDDISLPDRVINTWQVFCNNPDVVSISMQDIHIDEHGVSRLKLQNFCKEGKFSINNYIKNERIPVYGSTRAYRKILFDTFGPLSSRCQAEDLALVFRALLIGPIYHKAINAIYYRSHDKSTGAKLDFSSYKSVYRQNIRDLKRAVNLGLLIDIDIGNILNCMKSRFKNMLILLKFKNSIFKLFYFVYAILPLNLSVEDKKMFFIASMRQFIPDSIVKILKRRYSY